MYIEYKKEVKKMICTECKSEIEAKSSALYWKDSGKRKRGKIVMKAICERCI